MNKRIVCICMSVLLCLTIICINTGPDVYAGYYEDNDKYIKQRVADRMKEMSWEEKIAQMILVKAPLKMLQISRNNISLADMFCLGKILKTVHRRNLAIGSMEFRKRQRFRC